MCAPVKRVLRKYLGLRHLFYGVRVAFVVIKGLPDMIVETRVLAGKNLLLNATCKFVTVV